VEWALVLAIGLVAGTLGGIVGFGTSILLLPPLVLVFGPREAVPIMAIVALMANGSRVAVWWREVDWRACAAYSATGIPFAALGALTLLRIPPGAAELALGVFFLALERGRDLETARTLVVNTLVVLEIFYLFNVRYLGMTSITLRGALGTPAVLYALAAVVAAQLAFTYLPLMQGWFATRPVALADGALVIACGAALLLLFEGEKLLLRRFGLLGSP